MKATYLAAAAAVVSCAMALPAAAAVVRDQANYQFDTGIPWGLDFGGGNIQPNVGVSQTYTAGVKGRLDSVNLFCNGQCSINQLGNTLTLSVYKGNTLLATASTFTTNGTLETIGLPNFLYIPFNFNGKYVSQLVGQSYKWVLDGVTGPGDIKARGGMAAFGNPLPGGAGYAGNFYGNSYPEHDMTFYTKVLAGSVPEPASWAMLITGFGLVGGMARRRKALAA